MGLVVLVLDLGLLRYLLGPLEPLMGLEVLGAIWFARLRAREACPRKSAARIALEKS